MFRFTLSFLSTAKNHNRPGRRYAVAVNSELHAVFMSIRTTRVAEALPVLQSSSDIPVHCLTLHSLYLVARVMIHIASCDCTCKNVQWLKDP